MEGGGGGHGRRRDRHHGNNNSGGGNTGGGRGGGGGGGHHHNSNRRNRNNNGGGNNSGGNNHGHNNDGGKGSDNASPIQPTAILSQPQSSASIQQQQGGGGYSSQSNPSGASPSSNIPPLSSAAQASADGATYRDPSSVFPSSPYTPVSELTSTAQTQKHVANASSASAQRGQQQQQQTVTTVASSKFSHYSSIINIDPEPAPCTLAPGQLMQLYKTVNRFNGKQVILRRVVNTVVTAQRCADVAEQFRQFRHPSLVPLHSIIHTTEFALGHTDALLEYRYCRSCRSLGDILNDREEFSEAVLWSIASQLVSLVRTFHECGVALRGLHYSKLLFSELGNRIFFNGLGILDLVDPSKDPMESHQQADVQSIGLTLLRLATRNKGANTLEAMSKNPSFSPQFIAFLAACREGVKIQDLCRGMGERLAMEVGHQLGHADFLVKELSKEVHNGRIMKLLMKFNLVHAQCMVSAEQDVDLYTVRLFYHYLFNQVDEGGRPRFDWGHVFHALNKLDLGSEELVQLISMDHSDAMLIVISYRDLRGIIDRAADAMVQKSDAQ